ncbi:GvpL/GvpF family gas vesicle protein [bacterium]|nr:GvpL/GvpF family gas vesicle protein [bacterium]
MVEGIYLYCIVDSNKKISFGNIGLDNNEVYTIPYKDLGAVIHKCSTEPYKSEDKEKVKSWIIAHEKVIENAWERFGTIIPLGFDTIIIGEEEREPEENMQSWLKNDYENLKNKLSKLEGKAEFGIQIFWDIKIISERIIDTDKEIKKLSDEIKTKSKGLAYMYKQKLENILKKEIEKETDRYFKDFYDRVKSCVDEIKVDRTKKEEEKPMLMNLSCLLAKEKSKTLGGELDKIDQMPEFSVRFTGPWPPYSFV